MMILNIIQLILAITLILTILLQGKGSALGNVFGGTGNIYRTKRGAEKFLHFFTIFLSITFFGLALVQFIFF